jgi:hypothetical protein
MNCARAASLVLVCCPCLLPLPLAAQFRTTGDEAEAGWAPASIGVRVGFDNSQSRPMLGALARIPVIPGGAVELMPNADVTFMPGFKAYQLNLELVYLLQGRRSGFYAGGGVGFRDSVVPSDPNGPSRTEGTFSVLAGLRLGELGRVRPELETRWILDSDQARDPALVVFGASLALW